MSFDELERTMRAVERELALPERFLTSLLLDHDQDDWSFVIKLHTLVEATVAHLLAETVDPRLRDIFRRMGLRQRGGKVDFALALSLVNQSERRFLDTLSGVRNLLAHDVAQVTFRFAKYLDGLDRNQQAKFAEAVGSLTGATAQTVLEQPRLAVWAASVMFIVKSLNTAQSAQAVRALRQAVGGEAPEDRPIN